MLRKNKTYPLELKLQAVKMYIEDRIGSPTITKELGLTTNKRVLLWLNLTYLIGILQHSKLMRNG